VISRQRFDAEVFNVGSGSSLSVRDLICTLQIVVGETVTFEETGPYRDHEIPDVVADCRLSRDRLWLPQIDLNEGLKRMVSWESKHQSPSGPW
jgi:UDP-glucose 4-epimerase